VGLYKGSVRVTRPGPNPGRFVDDAFQPGDPVELVHDGPAEVQDLGREVARDPRGTPKPGRMVHVHLPPGTTKIGVQGGIQLEDVVEFRSMPDGVLRTGRVRETFEMDQSFSVGYGE